MNTITRERFEELRNKYGFASTEGEDSGPLYESMLRTFGKTVMTEEKVEQVFIENIKMNSWLNFANSLWEDEV